MLVLTRKLGERLVIGEVVVQVVGGGRVRIGVQAPRGVPIRREEQLGHDELAALDAAVSGGHQTVVGG